MVKPHLPMAFLGWQQCMTHFQSKTKKKKKIVSILYRGDQRRNVISNKMTIFSGSLIIVSYIILELDVSKILN